MHGDGGFCLECQSRKGLLKIRQSLRLCGLKDPAEDNCFGRCPLSQWNHLLVDSAGRCPLSQWNDLLVDSAGRR